MYANRDGTEVKVNMSTVGSLDWEQLVRDQPIGTAY